MTTDERREIQQQIERARDGVGNRIDELDKQLRTTLDIKILASEHATELVVGGAVIGFLAGFGLPRPLRLLISVGVPVGLFAWKLKQSRDEQDRARV